MPDLPGEQIAAVPTISGQNIQVMAACRHGSAKSPATVALIVPTASNQNSPARVLHLDADSARLLAWELMACAEKAEQLTIGGVSVCGVTT